MNLLQKQLLEGLSNNQYELDEFFNLVRKESGNIYLQYNYNFDILIINKKINDDLNESVGFINLSLSSDSFYTNSSFNRKVSNDELLQQLIDKLQEDKFEKNFYDYYRKEKSHRLFKYFEKKNTPNDLLLSPILNFSKISNQEKVLSQLEEKKNSFEKEVVTELGLLSKLSWYIKYKLYKKDYNFEAILKAMSNLNKSNLYMAPDLLKNIQEIIQNSNEKTKNDFIKLIFNLNLESEKK